MNKCLFLMVIFAMAYTSLASVSLALNAKHKDYPDQCYDSSDKVAYDFGTHRPTGKCFEVECTKEFTLHRYNCGVVGPPEGYHNEVDLTKPYPECCVNLVKD